jgi:primosomal replication protein N
MNRLVLSAQLIERGAMRYTPAGIPALDLTLKHEGDLTEDGRPRKVSLQIRGVAVGTITQAVGALTLGGAADFAGFLATSRNGRGLLFHVTAIDKPQAPSVT